MKKSIFALLPSLLLLAACQVGTNAGGALIPTNPPTSQPSVSPSEEPSATPEPNESPEPSASPTASVSPEPSASPTASALPSQPSLALTTLLDRNNVSQAGDKTLEIHDEAAFTQFWTAQAGDTEAKPAVDFSKNTVVAVYFHEAPYAGLGYEVTSVVQNGREVAVHYRQRTQQPDMSYLPVISYPTHAVSFPLSKQAGDYDTLVFVEDAPQPSATEAEQAGS